MITVSYFRTNQKKCFDEALQHKVHIRRSHELFVLMSMENYIKLFNTIKDVRVDITPISTGIPDDPIHTHVQVTQTPVDPTL